MSLQNATARSTCSLCAKPFTEQDPGRVVESYRYLMDTTSPEFDPTKPTWAALQLAPDRVLCNECCELYGYQETQEAIGLTRSPSRHGPDFRSVHWFGQDFSFTAKQAACVRILWAAWESCQTFR
jgi:hypothetical protein